MFHLLLPGQAHHASPFGLRVARPRRSRKGEACRAKPPGEDGAFQQSAIPLPFQSSHPACI